MISVHAADDLLEAIEKWAYKFALNEKAILELLQALESVQSDTPFRRSVTTIRERYEERQ